MRNAARYDPTIKMYVLARDDAPLLIGRSYLEIADAVAEGRQFPELHTEDGVVAFATVGACVEYIGRKYPNNVDGTWINTE